MSKKTGPIVLAFVLFTTAASAAEWVDIAKGDNGNRYSLDPRSVIRDRDTVTAVIRNEYATPRTDEKTGKNVFASLDRMVVNCETASFALQSRAYVAADGSEYTVLAASRDELSLRPAAKGSLSETIVRSVCRAVAGK